MKLRRILGLGSRHFGLLVYCFGLVLTLRLALTFSSYKAIAGHIRLRHDAFGEERSPYLIAWAVKHTARLVPMAHCLTQALAVQYLLAKQGTLSLVRVGIAEKPDGKVEAHAWVLKDGQIVIGGSESRISGFKSLIDLRPM